MSRNHSAALPIAFVFLRILIILNWVFGACILALLLFTFANEAWTMRALGVSGFSDAETVLWGMRAVAALGVVAVVLSYPMLKRLLAMVETVRRGDPFVAANAYRLQAIAWILLALQLLENVAARISPTSGVLEVRYTRGHGTLGPLMRSLETMEGKIQSLSVDDDDADASGDGTRNVTLDLRVNDPSDLDELVDTIGRRPEVRRVRIAGRDD